jgi:hypothetical protein
MKYIFKFFCIDAIIFFFEHYPNNEIYALVGAVYITLNNNKLTND